MPRLRPASDEIRFERLFGAPVRVAEYARPMLSDEVETAQTIHLMDELADADTAHRLVIEATAKALDNAGIALDASAREKAIAVYWFLKQTIRYVPTDGTSPLVDQTLIPPASLLAMPDPEGDCPQFSMLAAAMLRVCCVRSFYKTIAADPDFPTTYTHVYNVVEIAPDTFMPFDSSNGPAPGAEYAQRLKERVWPAVRRMKCDPSTAMRGRPATQRPRGMGMVKNYRRNPSNRNAVLRRGLAGTGHIFYPLQGTRMGDTVCDQDGNCYDTTDPNNIVQTSGAEPYYPSPTGASSSTIMQGPNPTAGELAAAGVPLTTMVATAPSPTTGNQSPSPTTLALALAGDATQIAAPLVKAATQQAPYYVTNPVTGQSVLYNPNTGTTAGALGASLSTISPTMMLIGIGLVALLAFSGKK